MEKFMLKITVDVDGMQCGMCENHVNEAVRGAFPVKKVSSSHGKKQTVIITEQDIDEQELKAVIDGTGYESGSAPYRKPLPTACAGSRQFGVPYHSR